MSLFAFFVLYLLSHSNLITASSLLQTLSHLKNDNKGHDKFYHCCSRKGYSQVLTINTKIGGWDWQVTFDCFFPCVLLPAYALCLFVPFGRHVNNRVSPQTDTPTHVLAFELEHETRSRLLMGSILESIHTTHTCML